MLLQTLAQQHKLPRLSKHLQNNLYHKRQLVGYLLSVPQSCAQKQMQRLPLMRRSLRLV